MQYARVGFCTVRPGTLDGILAKATAELVPQIRQQPGLVRYFTIRTGTDTLVAVTVWQTEDQAVGADERLSAWVRAEMGPSLVQVTNHVGALVASSVRSDASSGYARVGHWQFKPGTLDAAVELVRAELVPQIEHEPGYIGFGAAQTGPDRIISVFMHATQEQSRAAGAKAVAWIGDQIGASIASAERQEGAIVWRVGPG